MKNALLKIKHDIDKIAQIVEKLGNPDKSKFFEPKANSNQTREKQSQYKTSVIPCNSSANGSL